MSGDGFLKVMWDELIGKGNGVSIINSKLYEMQRSLCQGQSDFSPLLSPMRVIKQKYFPLNQEVIGLKELKSTQTFGKWLNRSFVQTRHWLALSRGISHSKSERPPRLCLVGLFSSQTEQRGERSRRCQPSLVMSRGCRAWNFVRKHYPNPIHGFCLWQPVLLVAGNVCQLLIDGRVHVSRLLLHFSGHCSSFQDCTADSDQDESSCSTAVIFGSYEQSKALVFGTVWLGY